MGRAAAGLRPTWRLAAALVLASALAHAAPVPTNASLGHDFQICPGVADHLHIASLEFMPDPIKPESTLHVVAKGTLDIAVSAATVKLAVSYYGVPVTSKSFDGCASFGLKCPQKAGTQLTGTIDYHIPNIPLSGVTLDVQIDVVDGQDKPISCLKTQARVGESGGRMRRLLEAFTAAYDGVRGAVGRRR